MEVAKPEIGAFTSAAGNALVFAANVAVSVLIVFVNKVLMAPPPMFTFATCLSALHFFVSSGMAYLVEGFKGDLSRVAQAPSSVPRHVYVAFSLLSASALASLNMSLLVNKVGFYQVAKLLVIPFTCMMESFLFGRTFSGSVILAIVTVVTGVGLVTVAEVAVGPLGVLVAAVSVVTSGGAHIMCGFVQRTYDISANHLLLLTGPIQGFVLLAAGPFVDYLMCKRWVWDYDWDTTGVAVLLAVSCALAAGVNATYYMVLGKFNASTFQVLGHSKAVLILTCSWLFLHEHLTLRQAVGMTLAVGGMILFGYLQSRPKQALEVSAKALVSPVAHVSGSEVPGSLTKGVIGQQREPLLDVSNVTSGGSGSSQADGLSHVAARNGVPGRRWPQAVGNPALADEAMPLLAPDLERGELSRGGT